MTNLTPRKLRLGRGAAAGVIAAALGGWTLVAAPAGRERKASAGEVEAAVRSLEEAWEREDLEAAVGAFTPDAVAYDPVPPGKFEGTEGIRGWTAGSFAMLEQISITISELRVQTEGPVAWATARFVFEGRQEGRPLREVGYMSTVWVVQEDGSLKMTVFHASHMPPPAGGGSGKTS